LQTAAVWLSIRFEPVIPVKQLLLPFLAASFATASALAQDWARARIEKSPRHLEWVKVTHDNRTVQSFVAYPEVKDKATAVVVIHEIFGLSDWVRSVTDQFAAAGCIAIAPDLLSGMGPKGGGSDELGVGDGVRRVIGDLPPAQITADLDAVIAYAAQLPACNGKVVVVGFCWGGGEAFRCATNNAGIRAAFVCYGTGPTAAGDVARIHCPVYGFYGGDDARVGATLAQTTALMKAAGKTYDPVVYKGAGHGFMRAGEDPTDTGARAAANKKARAEVWQRWTEILRKI